MSPGVKSRATPRGSRRDPSGTGASSPGGSETRWPEVRGGKRLASPELPPRELSGSRARAATGDQPPRLIPPLPPIILGWSGGMKLRMVGGGAVPKARETRFPRVSTDQQHLMTWLSPSDVSGNWHVRGDRGEGPALERSAQWPSTEPHLRGGRGSLSHGIPPGGNSR